MKLIVVVITINWFPGSLKIIQIAKKKQIKTLFATDGIITNSLEYPNTIFDKSTKVLQCTLMTSSVFSRIVIKLYEIQRIVPQIAAVFKSFNMLSDYFFPRINFWRLKKQLFRKGGLQA